MNYLVLFSIALIVGSVIILVSPLNHRTNVMPIQEGFDATSKQEFVPEDVDDNPMDRPRNTKDRIASAMLHQHQHGGSINVYHHKGDKQSGNKQSDKQSGKQSGDKQSGDKQSGNQRSNGQSSTYQEPVAGATVLGFL